MADSEAWRRERAERLFPAKPFGGAPRPQPGAAVARERPDEVLPMQRPPVRQAPPPLVTVAAPTPRPEQPRAAPAVEPACRTAQTRTRTNARPLLAGAFALAVLAAALLGWLAGRSSLPVAPSTIAVNPAVPAPARPAPSPPAVSPAPIAEPDRAAAMPDPAPAAPIVEAALRPDVLPARAAIDRPAAVSKPSARETTPPSVDRLRLANPTPLAGRDFGPSFDCRRATALSNRLICDDPALAALDNRLARAFRARIAGVDLPTARAIDAEQTSFINERIACTTRGCIERVYRARLAQLAAR